MKDILYFNTLEDIKIVDMLRTTSKEKELPNLIILTILSAGAGEVTPIFLKDNGEVSFTSIYDIGTKFILDGKEITSDDFLIIEEKELRFGLLFEDSNEHTLKISLINSTILPYLFFYNIFLTKVIISNSITSIGDYAFNYCTGLTSVSIGNSVTSIGDYAFKDCAGLTSIFIPDSVIEIGDHTFNGCTGLASVEIPNSVTKIGGGTFQGCTGLTSIIIPNSVTEIGNGAFINTSLTSVIIPNSVTLIPYECFYYCTSLTSVTVPDSVTEIGSAAFNNCSSLASIISLATTAPSISNNTFYNVKTLGTLHVPSGSNYSTWMSTGNYYLGKYNWIKVEDALPSAPSSIDPLPLFPPDDAV